MKRTKPFQIVTTVVLIYMFIFSTGPAQAALSMIYEGRAGGATASAPQAQKVKAQRQTTTKAQNTQAKQAGSGPKVLWSRPLTKKEIKLIQKEHDRFCNAFINAELGMRYYVMQYYNGMYRGKKMPTDEQSKAMSFEVNLLMNDLRSSAKRYASNLRMAKIAMMKMDEEERTFFAKALEKILATPAYAAGTVDAAALDSFADNLSGIAASTQDLSPTTARGLAEAIQEANAREASSETTWGEICTIGIRGAMVVKMGTTFTGMLIACVMTGPAGVKVIAVTGGMSGFVAMGSELMDEVFGDKLSKEELAKNKGSRNKLRNVESLASITSFANSIKNIKFTDIDNLKGILSDALGVYDNKDQIISMIEDSLERLSSDFPGAQKVEAASDNADKGGGGGNGGGNGGGCGC